MRTTHWLLPTALAMMVFPATLLAQSRPSIAAMQAAIDAQATQIVALQNSVADNSVPGLATFVSVDSSDPARPSVRISGANLQVVNNSGSTQTANGVGNLILGDDELRTAGDATCSVITLTTVGQCLAGGGVWSLNHRTGSHNVIVGDLHNYTAYASLVSGRGNDVRNIYASAIGGNSNLATGDYGVIVGGVLNTVEGTSTVVAGGTGNRARGTITGVFGGSGNGAGIEKSVVVGGVLNEALGEGSVVVGGSANQTLGTWSLVAGGVSNLASSTGSLVSGGNSNLATGNYSSVSGGFDHIAAGVFDWVGAGAVFADQ